MTPRRPSPRRITRPAIVTIVAVVLLAACGTASERADDRDQTETSSTTRASAATDSTTTTTTRGTVSASAVAPETFAVGIWHTATTRDGRNIPVTVWYPSSTKTGLAPVADAPAAAGTHPIVLFSHGVRATPDAYQELVTQWAEAGFVVVAPTYPYTNRDAPDIQPNDVKNQPADASAALTTVIHAATAGSGPVGGHVDRERIVAVGHSEGAVTTVGLFDECCRDPRLDAGIVLAGNSLGFPGAPSGSAAPMLFVHGDADHLVPIFSGRRAYAEFSWPRAFMTLAGEGHIDPYLQSSSGAFTRVAATTIAFLRWTTGTGSVDAVRAAAGSTLTDDHLTGAVATAPGADDGVGSQLRARIGGSRAQP